MVDDPAVERAGVEEFGVDPAWEGVGLACEVGEVLRYRACAVRGEGQDLPRIFQTFAGETHVLLTLAGDVLEATTVDDAHVRKVTPTQGAAGDQWPWH
jgi:hypothetical protein